MKIKKRICVLEDDGDIREIIIILLESEHYEVIAFANCKSFFSGIQGASPDAFVLDVMLPDGNGLNVCNLLKNSSGTQKIPVIMMSATHSPIEIKNGCGAEDFIRKPFDIGDFVNRVDAQIQ